MATSIPISGLDVDSVIQSQDFIPLVNSASLTTYRTSIQSFGNWMAVSGSSSSSLSSISSSYSSHSITSSYAISASLAFSSLSSSNSINSINASSASFLSGPHTGSTFGTSSWSSNAVKAITASYANQASNSVSASYANQASNSVSAAFASNSNSSSYALNASHAITSSYAVTASFASVCGGNTIYPYIQSINMTCRNDDNVDVYMNGLSYTLGGHPFEQFDNNASGTGISYQVIYYPTSGSYIATRGGTTIVGVWGTPVQSCVLTSDNRGGGPFYWYFDGNPVIIQFALSPTITATHQYTTTSNNYAGSIMMINAIRASMGLNSIQYANGNSTIGVFPSFIIS